MPERFGGYEIERRLGAGGMAEVFLAHRRGPEGFAKRVALKRVLPGYNSDPEFVRLFQDEARLAARLDHPHIAGIHDFGEVDGIWYMAMEYVDGSDLRSLLAGLTRLRQPMPIDLVLLLAADLASALLYAHELEIDGRPAHIVHRDVTPSNILVSVDGAIRLADFGIAKAASHGHHTRTGIVKGKVPYMPPEQALGERIDHRADLFALGVVLFECIAGKRPYVGVTELDTLQKISKGQHPPLLELAPHAPPVLVEVVERLIRPRADDRFASAADVLDALAATPPPTNARRLLGNLVRRVQREVPRSVSSVRGFGVARTEPLDEPAMQTRTSGEAARLALAAVSPPREDVASALERAALEPTPPAPPPLGRASDLATQATRPLPVRARSTEPSTAPPSAATLTAHDRPFAAGAPTGPTGARRPPLALIAVVLGVGLVAVVGVGAGALGLWLHAGARAVGEPDGALATAPIDAPPTPILEASPEPPRPPIVLANVADEPSPVAAGTDDRGALATARSESMAVEASSGVEAASDGPEGAPGPSAPSIDGASESVEAARSRSSSRRARREEPAARTAPSAVPDVEPAPGRVHVVALPVGDVTIDGRDHGSAPVSVSLRPGRHVVVVRNGDREERRTVEIASERTERIIVRFPREG